MTTSLSPSPAGTAHRARWTASRVAVAAAMVLVLAGLGACGDDDDDAAAPDTPEESAEEPTDSGNEVAEQDADPAAEGSFCEGFLGVEAAFAEVPDDEAEIGSFVEERITPNLALVHGNEPEEIADEVRVMTATIEEVASTGNFSAFESPEFSDASAAVYSTLDEVCDVAVVEFTAVDYSYEGVPTSLAPGQTSFVMTNESESGEAHEFALVKLRDDAELPLEEILALPEAEADQYVETFAAGVFAPADRTSGSVVDLEPGRWAYVCFLPVGSTEGEDGDGPPHFVEGMAGEFTVE